MRIAIAAIIFCLTISCNSNSVPGEYIQPEKMVPLVSDMIKADELVNNYVLRDTALKSKTEHIKMYEQVFLIHNTNKQEFYKSLKYYQQNPQKNKALFDSISALITREQQVITQAIIDTTSK